MKRIIFLLSAPILIFLYLAPALGALPEFIHPKIGAVSGQVFVDGQPQALALVAFFLEKNGPPPVAGGMRRVPEFIARTDAAAKFKVNLIAGNYYLGIMARAPGAPSGPPRAGEIYHFAANDQGEFLLLSVVGREFRDSGRIDGAPPSNFNTTAEFFTVNGTVFGEDGTPVAKVAVLGKSQLNIRRPGFISERTGEDGRFSLRLPAGKSFYLLAREDIATSRPLPGNYVGTYGIHSKTGLATLSMFSASSPPPGVPARDEESRALTVTGAAGETIDGLEIFMYPVPDPESIKLSVRGRVEAQEFEQDVRIENILFSLNSSDLEKTSHQELDRWAAFLAGQGQAEIEVIGHTDNLGSTAANLLLSENRAMSVALYLIAAGVAPSRIKISGMGGTKPVADNATPEGRTRNRRVEIRFINLAD